MKRRVFAEQGPLGDPIPFRFSFPHLYHLAQCWAQTASSKCLLENESSGDQCWVEVQLSDGELVRCGQGLGSGGVNRQLRGANNVELLQSGTQRL